MTRKDKVRNGDLTGTAKAAKLEDKLRGARLRCYGHVRRREEGYMGRRMLETAVLGTRMRGTPKRRWLDMVRENMVKVGAMEGDKGDGVKRRRMTHYCDPERT